jgi:hypothetical protein
MRALDCDLDPSAWCKESRAPQTARVANVASGICRPFDRETKDGAGRPHPVSSSRSVQDRDVIVRDHGQMIFNPFDVFAVDALQKFGVAWR